MNKVLFLLLLFNWSHRRRRNHIPFSLLMALLQTHLSTRELMFMDDDTAPFLGKNVWATLSQRRRQFYDVTGETPETFLRLYGEFVQSLRPPIRNTEPISLSRRNMLLITLMWLKTYPCYHTLAVIFEISDVTVHRIVTRVWPLLHTHFAAYIVWPSRRQWRGLRGGWSKLPEAVGCIDGTSHEIYVPKENQHLYFSGHRRYHCIHTQVIIDNEFNIRHVESGFRGHTNDAQTFRLMTPIGDGAVLDVPPDCYLLGDCIYPSRHPLITPFTAAQIRRQPVIDQHRLRVFNRTVRRYRVFVEHMIYQLKLFRVTGTLFRHRRNHVGQIVTLCACLAQRRAVLFFG